MPHPHSPLPTSLPATTSRPSEEQEVLSPAPTTSIRLVPTPDLSAPFADFRSEVEKALAIPGESWPPGNSVTFRLDLALVPVGVTVTIDKKTVPNS